MRKRENEREEQRKKNKREIERANVLARSSSGHVWVIQGPKALANPALLHWQAWSSRSHSPKARAVEVQLT